MCKIVVNILLLLALLGGIQGIAWKAGKCDTVKIQLFDFDFHSLAHIENWDFLYATDVDNFCEMDHDLRLVIPYEDETYFIGDKTVMKKGNKSSEVYRMSFIDNVVYEDFTDENGKHHQLRNYVLLLTPENAIYYYRCSDTGHSQADTRYVIIPHGNKLSDSSWQRIIELDTKMFSRGRLCKLPQRLPEM